MLYAKDSTMARAKTFSLGDTYDDILADLVRAGRFDTEAEALRAGLRMLADREARIQSLRQAIGEADAEIAAGEGLTYEGAHDLLTDVLKDDD